MTCVIYGAVFALLMARFARQRHTKEIHIRYGLGERRQRYLKRPMSMAELTIHVAGM
jgi:uncharacterized membrane protein YdbT with pleckstrin-like domain